MNFIGYLHEIGSPIGMNIFRYEELTYLGCIHTHRYKEVTYFTTQYTCVDKFFLYQDMC